MTHTNKTYYQGPIVLRWLKDNTNFHFHLYCRIKFHLHSKESMATSVTLFELFMNGNFSFKLFYGDFVPARSCIEFLDLVSSTIDY
jgi:hypothetical protein